MDQAPLHLARLTYCYHLTEVIMLQFCVYVCVRVYVCMYSRCALRCPCVLYSMCALRCPCDMYCTVCVHYGVLVICTVQYVCTTVSLWYVLYSMCALMCPCDMYCTYVRTYIRAYVHTYIVWPLFLKTPLLFWLFVGSCLPHCDHSFPPSFPSTLSFPCVPLS